MGFVSRKGLNKTISHNSWTVHAGISTEEGFARNALAPVPTYVATAKGQTTLASSVFIPLKSMLQRPLDPKLNPNMVNKPYPDQNLASNNGSENKYPLPTPLSIFHL